MKWAKWLVLIVVLVWGLVGWLLLQTKLVQFTAVNQIPGYNFSVSEILGNVFLYSQKYSTKRITGNITKVTVVFTPEVQHAVQLLAGKDTAGNDIEFSSLGATTQGDQLTLSVQYSPEAFAKTQTDPNMMSRDMYTYLCMIFDPGRPARDVCTQKAEDFIKKANGFHLGRFVKPKKKISLRLFEQVEAGCQGSILCGGTLGDNWCSITHIWCDPNNIGYCHQFGGGGSCVYHEWCDLGENQMNCNAWGTQNQCTNLDTVASCDISCNTSNEHFCTWIPSCSPDCSCAADICQGSTCGDGCGGTCNGTKTPDCSCAADTCIGSTCGDGCGGTCDGTKVCVACQVNSISPNPLTLNTGSTGTLTANTSVQGGTISNVTFVSGNTNVATINPSSDSSSPYQTVATGGTAGSSTLTATCHMPGGQTGTGTSTITVPTPDCTVTLTPNPVTVETGAKATLLATVTATNSTIARVTFVSNNTTIATVSPASDDTLQYQTEVTGGNGGSTTVTATCHINESNETGAGDATINVPYRCDVSATNTCEFVGNDMTIKTDWDVISRNFPINAIQGRLNPEPFPNWPNEEGDLSLNLGNTFSGTHRYPGIIPDIKQYSSNIGVFAVPIGGNPQGFACVSTNLPFYCLSSGTIQARALTVNPTNTSCATIRAGGTGGIAGSTFTFSPSSPSHPAPVPPSQVGSQYIVYDPATAGNGYTIQPTIPAGYLPARYCWQRTTAPTTGETQSADLPAGDTLTWDIGYMHGVPWSQASGGDVYAALAMQSLIPPPIPPNPHDVFIKNGTGGYPGVATYGTSANFDWSGITNGQDWVSSQKWLAHDTAPAPDTDYYQLMVSQFGGFPDNPDWTDPASPIPKPASRTTPYYVQGNMSTSGDWVVTAGQKVIFIVDGNLSIEGRINITGTGFVAFIVNGNITIDPSVGVPYISSVPVVEGIYITDPSHSFITGTGSGPATDRFVGQGSFIAGNFLLQRNVRDAGNTTTASELFLYDPQLLMTMPEPMKKLSVSWQEVAP